MGAGVAEVAEDDQEVSDSDEAVPVEVGGAGAGARHVIGVKAVAVVLVEHRVVVQRRRVHAAREEAGAIVLVGDPVEVRGAWVGAPEDGETDSSFIF